MLKICVIVISFFQYCLCRPPAKPYYLHMIKHYKAEIMLNMTYYLCKDATIKLWHADKIQQRYKGSISYELGIITAGIQDIFKKMVKVYRKYSNLTNFRFSQYGAEEILEAYQVMKADFNALRMQRNMFNDVLNNHQDRLRMASSTRYKLYAKGKPKRRSEAYTLVDKEAYLRRRLKYEKWTEHDNFKSLMDGDLD